MIHRSEHGEPVNETESNVAPPFCAPHIVLCIPTCMYARVRVSHVSIQPTAIQRFTSHRHESACTLVLLRTYGQVGTWYVFAYMVYTAHSTVTAMSSCGVDGKRMRMGIVHSTSSLRYI